MDFLNLIDDTISRLEADSAVFTVYAADVRGVIAVLADSRGPAPLDPEGKVSTLLSEAAAAANRLYEKARIGRDSAIADEQLQQDDGVAEAFEIFMQKIEDFHNAIEDLRDTLETVDALRSPVIGTFDNTADLFKALDS